MVSNNQEEYNPIDWEIRQKGFVLEFCPPRRISLVKRQIEKHTTSIMITKGMETCCMTGGKEGPGKLQVKIPWNTEQRKKNWEEESEKYKLEKSITVEVEPKRKGQCGVALSGV